MKLIIMYTYDVSEYSTTGKSIKGKEPRVEGVGDPFYTIGNKLIDSGYAIGSSVRLGGEDKARNCIGIFKQTDPIERKFLFFKYYEKQPTYHIGVLWFHNEAKDARKLTKWILDIYGEEYYSELTKFCEQAAKMYDVKLQTVLRSQERRVAIIAGNTKKYAL